MNDHLSAISPEPAPHFSWVPAIVVVLVAAAAHRLLPRLAPSPGRQRQEPSAAAATARVSRLSHSCRRQLQHPSVDDQPLLWPRRCHRALATLLAPRTFGRTSAVARRVVAAAAREPIAARASQSSCAGARAARRAGGRSLHAAHQWLQPAGEVAVASLATRAGVPRPPDPPSSAQWPAPLARARSGPEAAALGLDCRPAPEPKQHLGGDSAWALALVLALTTMTCMRTLRAPKLTLTVRAGSRRGVHRHQH